MKIEILQENLSAALSQALKFVSSKAQLPILGNILMEAKEGNLKISASDMENSIVLWVGAKIEEDGDVCVSAKVFSDFIFALLPGKVALETKEDVLLVSSQKNKAKLSTMPPSEFPKPEENKEEKELLSFSIEEIKRIKEKISFAVSGDVSRPQMTGIYLDNKNQKLKIVGTDGFRLSLLEKNGKEEDFVLNIQSKIVEDLEKMGGAEDSVKIFLNETKTQAIFRINETEVASRLIDGKYPPYEKIIPTGHTISVVFDREDLLRAVKTAGIFSKDSSNIVRLKFEENLIKIVSQTPNLGENESEIECEKTGEDIEINFNFKFLVDVLSSIKSKEVIFETEGEGRPCVFKEKDVEGFLHLIMPVKKS